MEALVYFVLWAGVIFLVMRWGWGARVTGPGRILGNFKGERRAADGGTIPWRPPERVDDVVCGRRVVAHNAKTSVFEGEVYFFCSRECRELFETAPEIYVNGRIHVSVGPDGVTETTERRDV